MESSGSGGAEEPGEGNRTQEPAATSPSSNGNGAPTAVPPPPPPPPPPRRRQQPGGGAPADGSSPSAAAADPKGKQIALPTPPNSSGSSADYGAAFGDGAFEAGEWSGRKRVTWSEPVVVGTTEVPAEARAGPRAPPQSLESKQVFEQMVLKQLVLEQLLREHAALHKDDDSLETLPQIKERPEHEKLPHVKCISVWSHLKNKIFHRERREICSEHVAHQTHPITEVRRLYKIPLNTANHLDAYSECRAVIGDGDCFYRSFIFSYLEQVIDRQDADEERRLLDVVKRVSTQHANLRWISEFPSSSRVFKKLIKKVMKWKRHGRSDSMESTSSYHKAKLLVFFSEYDTTEYIYIFLRLVVAIQMCSHKEEYEPRIPGLTGDYTLEDWCCQRVTPARRLTNDVMMLALATAFEVPLRVETFREGYAPPIYTGPGPPRPSVTLLYTGDHYEIIYPRAPSTESSSQQTSQREHLADQSSSEPTS